MVDPAPGGPAARGGESPRTPPRLALAIVCLTLMGFLLSSPLGLAPAWIAVAGAAAISLPALARRRALNNIPAILIVAPVMAVAGPAAVLAALIGVNIGPNLTYTGSLATLLWRRTLRTHNSDASPGEFLRLGALSVPLALIASTAVLWLVAPLLS